MKKKLKGGIEGIVALIVFAGLVIALIIAAVLPSVQQTSAMGNGATDTIINLRTNMGQDVE